MDQNIFALIGTLKEKTELWQELGNVKGDILCKGQEDTLCKLKASFYDPQNQTLECTVESPTGLEQDEDYLGHFFLGNEKYYFQASAILQKGKFIVLIPKELYKLQRRQNYRVHIPEIYHAFFNIININNKACHHPCSLEDLSSQGCRINHKFKELQLQINDTVTGQLLVGKRAPIEIQGVVRHTKKDDFNHQLMHLGIEFLPLSSMLESKLFAITMELHKELFKRPV